MSMLEVVVCLTEDSSLFFPQASRAGWRGVWAWARTVSWHHSFFSPHYSAFFVTAWIWVYLDASLISTRPFPLPDQMVLCPKPPSQSSRHPSTTAPFCRSLCWLPRPKVRQSFLTDWLLNPPHQRSMPPSEALRTINFLLPFLCCSSMAVSTWSCWWT